MPSREETLEWLRARTLQTGPQAKYARLDHAIVLQQAATRAAEKPTRLRNRVRELQAVLVANNEGRLNRFERRKLPRVRAELEKLLAEARPPAFRTLEREAASLAKLAKRTHGRTPFPM